MGDKVFSSRNQKTKLKSNLTKPGKPIIITPVISNEINWEDFILDMPPFNGSNYLNPETQIYEWGVNDVFDYLQYQVNLFVKSHMGGIKPKPIRQLDGLGGNTQRNKNFRGRR